MNEIQRDNWKFEVLNELLRALAGSPQLREILIFKGALILNLHLGTHRKSLDIDSNLDSTFTLQRTDREEQKDFLQEHVRRAITRYFETREPVRYQLMSLRIESSPKEFHPRGWDTFVISVSLIDHVHSGIKRLPSLTIDVAAPETLSANSVTDMELDGVTIRAYTLERITGEKARAFLSTLPTYRSKAQKPGKAVRVKDLYDIASIARSKPLSDIPFWTTAGNEFRLACESRGVDCIGRDSFVEGWAETREHYLKEPIIPKDIPFIEVEGAIDSIIDFWKYIGIVPFTFLLPEKTR